MNDTNSNIQLLDFLTAEGLEVFSPEQLLAHYGRIETKVYVQLDAMVKQGWLTKLKKGLYAYNPMSHRGKSFMPNWHKVADGLMYPRPYYIGYYSALQIHELITQPALKEYIISPTRVHPKKQQIQDVSFEIIHYQESRFYGYKKNWIDDHTKVYCSDIEKTLIDCISKPQYAGGLEGIIKAIDKAQNRIKPKVLIEYAIKFNSQAVIKRLGYIMDKMDLYPSEQKILNALITDAYTRLDPSLKIKGRFHRKWRIEDNVDLEELLHTTET